MSEKSNILQTDFFSDSVAAAANRTLEVEIATASRVGLDGATIASARVDAGGRLIVTMTDGRTIDAGSVVGQFGLKGIAHFDTIPAGSSEAQLYIASGKGTYGYFRNRWGQPVQIDRDNTIAFFYCPPGGSAWDYTEMTLEWPGLRKSGPILLSSHAPVFSCYPPAVEAVEGLYDEATGRFTLPEGETTVCSQSEVFGEIVYTDCSYIMIGFNLSWALYLETATGRCLMMDVFTRETHYHNEPFAESSVAKKYVRVNTYNAESMIIDIEESDNGRDYTPYARVNRGAWPGLFITYRTIGFYRPAGSASRPKILSTGASDRLMLDDVPLLADPAPGTFEVLVPSDNFAGVARRRIAPGGKTFAGKRIVLYGDSIVGDYGIAPGTFAGLIRRKFDTDDVIAHGQIGEKLGSQTDDKSDSLTDDQQIGFVTAQEPDLLIVQGGSSDYWHAVPLGDLYGDIESAAYVKTTTGGLRYLLHHFTKNLPRNSRVLFVTPPPGIYQGEKDTEINAAGHRMDEYVRRFRDICAEYHVPVCDFWATAGWPVYREATEPKYTIDGVHLSVEGYDRLTDRLFAEASRYC
jgi:lysophospholipase L1-like esterase